MTRPGRERAVAVSVSCKRSRLASIFPKPVEKNFPGVAIDDPKLFHAQSGVNPFFVFET
jgi:hypothetical protein